MPILRLGPAQMSLRYHPGYACCSIRADRAVFDLLTAENYTALGASPLSLEGAS